MNRSDRFLFKEGFRKIEEDCDGGGAQDFHRLSNCRQRGIVDGRRRHVVESNDRAVPGNHMSSLTQRADRPEGGDVVKRQKRGELPLSAEQFSGCAESGFRAAALGLQLNVSLGSISSPASRAKRRMPFHRFALSTMF